jgi:GT2 family glycosyltransferase
MASDTLDPSVWNGPNEAGLARLLGTLFDADWYLTRHPDIAGSDTHPMVHFVRHGATEWRDPNAWFDTAWYVKHYPDALDNGSAPLLHYILVGAAESRNPHPRFDAAWYVEQHPEAADNPLLYHLTHGVARGYPTERPDNIADYLPSERLALLAPDVRADIVIPVYRGLAETRVCIESVLADASPVLGRVIVVDDRSPEPALTAWLAEQAVLGRITLIRNRRNMGFAATVNAGVAASDGGDIVVLHNDTIVPAGWLGRLAAQAYAEPHIATVSPFSANAGLGSYEFAGFDPSAIDAACRSGNRGRWVDLPATSGCCVYIRRQALTDIGSFDAQSPDSGYGAETDFGLRAAANGWVHRLAADVFVAHEGRMSFGRLAAGRTGEALLRRYPTYAKAAKQQANYDSVAPARFAVTAALFRPIGAAGDPDDRPHHGRRCAASCGQSGASAGGIGACVGAGGQRPRRGTVGAVAVRRSDRDAAAEAGG